MKSLVGWVTFSNSREMKKSFLRNVMEFSNRWPSLRYSYYSNEYYSLKTYGSSDKHFHMDPYGHHSKNNDKTTKFMVISECIFVSEGETVSEFWLCFTQSSQSEMAGRKSKED